MTAGVILHQGFQEREFVVRIVLLWLVVMVATAAMDGKTGVGGPHSKIVNDMRQHICRETRRLACRSFSDTTRYNLFARKVVFVKGRFSWICIFRFRGP